MNELTKYGYVSNKAMVYGHTIWQHENGEEVLVTNVSDTSPESIHKEYKFDDVMYIGKVVKCLRSYVPKTHYENF